MTQTSPTEQARPAAAHVLIFALYVVFAIALTYPLAFRIATVVPNDLGDPLLNTWILWWNATHVPLTSAWWNAPAFFPAENALTFSEHLAGLSPLSSPIYWLTGRAQVSYNVIFLLSFPLCAFSNYLLCLHLTGRRDAAFLGGLAFGFAPYRIAQFPHLQVLVSFWMPLALLGLHRFVRGDGAKWLGLFAVAWLLQSLSNGYYLAFFSVLVGIWVLWFVRWQRWKTALAIGAAWSMAIAVLLPILIRYRQAHEAFGFRRRYDEIVGYSADVLSIFDASPALAVWGFLRNIGRPESELFPGVTVVVLIAIGLVWWKNDSGSRFTKSVKRPLRWGLLVAGIILGAAAASAFISPWEVTLAGMRISANQPEKPLTLSLIALLLFAVTSPRMIDAFNRRSAFAFYVLAAGVMWMMCLGPEPTFLNVKILLTAPYAWLLHVPGWDALRVPARFTMLMSLCIAIAAALAYPRLAPSLAGRGRLIMTALLSVAILADGWIGHMPLEQIPAAWPRGTTRTAGAVLSLPLGDPGDDLIAMYRGMQHGKPIVNGYSGNFPTWYASLQMGLAARDPGVLDELAALGVTEVVLDTSLDQNGELDRYIRTRSTRLDNPGGQFAVYRLTTTHARTEGPRVTLGPILPIQSITVSVNPPGVPAMTDGKLDTRWETGPQVGTEDVVIDLGSPQPIGAVVLALGPYGSDFPRDLQIELSDDGQNWSEAWRGAGTGPAFAAAIRDPKRVPIVLSLGNRRARYIHLSQHAKEPTYYWSIAELSVHKGISN